MLALASGISFIQYRLSVSKNVARIAFYITSQNKAKNKEAFDYLLKNRDEIDSEIGYKLKWDRRDEHSASQISHECMSVKIDNKDDWKTMVSFFIRGVENFRMVFGKRIEELKKILSD